MNREAAEALICELGRRMYARNLIAGADGNLSCRLGADTFLVTRSGSAKGYLTPADIVVANAQGERVEGEGKVSSEFYTHLAAYEERPETQAVVHAHPPVATALTVAGVSLAEPVLPEIVMNMGGIPTCAYATPGTAEGAASIREHIRHCDTVMLDRHGALAIGDSLLDAYYKLERLEHAALTLWHAHCLGPLTPLSPEQVARIHAAGVGYGVKARLLRS
jgi:L-fuculose-phosphate aldolase